MSIGIFHLVRCCIIKDGFLICMFISPSWLVRHLVLTYPEYFVVCYDNRGYCSSLRNIECLKDRKNFVFEQGDVCDQDKLQHVMDKYKVDTIIHMAAESHVDNSFGKPFQFTQTNVFGTQVLLEVAKSRVAPTDGFKPLYRFIHMSTDEVYGEVRGADKDLLESAILAPTNPYAASKAAGDMLIGAYLKSFNVPAIIVRCNNVYGPLQFPEKIIPKFIRFLQRKQPCTLHGNGLNTRRYLYASDAINGLDTVLHKGRVGSIYNAGSDMELSNLEVCTMLLKLFDLQDPQAQKYITYTTDRPFNDFRYAIDSSRLGKLGWKPEVDFKKGLKRTVDWYNMNEDTWWDQL